MSSPRAARTVIDVWLADHPFPGFLDPVHTCADEFNAAHPDYQVELHGYSYWTNRGRFYADIESGAITPAVADFFYTATQRARDTRRPDGAPAFTSVERAVAGRREILGEPVVLDDLEPTARAYYAYHGDLVSLPSSVSTSVLYANTTLLAAAGVHRMPTTWDEVESACAAVAALTDGPGHGIIWPNHGWFFQQGVAEQSGLLADNDNGRSARATAVDLASKEMLTWVSWWQRMHTAGHYLYTGTAMDWEGTIAAFLDQRVAFMLNSSVMAEDVVTRGAAAGFTAAAGRMPYNGALPYGGDVIGGDSLWLGSGLDKTTEDGALAFMQYLLNPVNAAAWHKVSGFIPVTRSAFALLEEQGWFADKPHQRVANDQFDACTNSPGALGALLGDFSDIDDVMTAAMHDVLVHGADLVPRFVQATGQAQRVLDAYSTAYPARL